MKKLVLVWNGGDRQQIIIPLAEVTEEQFREFTERFGAPKGRTVTINSEGEVMQYE